MSFDLDRFRELYLTDTPDPPPGVELSEAFQYIHWKAFIYSRLGPDAYRPGDVFQMPPADWPEVKFEAVKVGCEQIVQWRGLSPDSPLEGVGVAGFYALMRLLHFNVVEHAALDGGPDMILDEMTMKHAVDGRPLTLYNLVKSPIAEWQPGPPCPYCQQPLRTAKAKQCRACGMDWHDPSNVVSRKSAPSGE